MPKYVPILIEEVLEVVVTKDKANYGSIDYFDCTFGPARGYVNTRRRALPLSSVKESYRGITKGMRNFVTYVDKDWAIGVGLKDRIGMKPGEKKPAAYIPNRVSERDINYSPIFVTRIEACTQEAILCKFNNYKSEWIPSSQIWVDTATKFGVGDAGLTLYVSNWIIQYKDLGDFRAPAAYVDKEDVIALPTTQEEPKPRPRRRFIDDE